ncbi:MAG: HemK2/MTQ2 family protein methyltransferase [Candidatus Micrarchaeia archaeon]
MRTNSPGEISFGTLRLRLLPTVYEPAEDSFLLATYASSLSGRVLEVGCGSGIASLSAAQASPKNSVLGVDINPAAVECSRQNAGANNLANAAFRVSDLFSSVPAGEKFDSILFNPPYLPTTREEKLALELENAAYDGGASGLDCFMRFAAQAPAHLAPGGKIAVIATSLGGGMESTLSELEKRIGPAKILAQESFFFEKIALVQANRADI